MKKSLIVFLGLTFSLSSLALTITDKTYEFTGNVTTISLTDSGGVINVVGKTSSTVNLNLKLDNFTFKARSQERSPLMMTATATVLADKVFGSARVL